eukprot:scaffold6600_cov125-Isochrysis_galbana.AAC.13
MALNLLALEKDVWLARYRFGRAHIILNTPLDKLLAPINKNNTETSRLPVFWKEAIQDLRELELKRRHPSPRHLPERVGRERGLGKVRVEEAVGWLTARAGRPGLDVPECHWMPERWALGRASHRAAIGGRELVSGATHRCGQAPHEKTTQVGLHGGTDTWFCMEPAYGRADSFSHSRCLPKRVWPAIAIVEEHRL